MARDTKIVHYEAQGMQDKEAGIPLSQETIFRIYSMSKPITGVAAMILSEQGKSNIQDPKSTIRIIDFVYAYLCFSYGFINSEAQFVPTGFHRYHDDFRNLVYQALED
ncbi:MAG: hypothetical protein ACI88A_001655 [Paraglaciecola sp.]